MPNPPDFSVSIDGTDCRLAGTLDFTTARNALDQVASAIQSDASVSIDFSGVTQSNSAGLALIVEWQAIAQRAGHKIQFSNVPDGLRQLARVCQVDSLI